MIDLNRGNGRAPAPDPAGDFLSFGTMLRMVKRQRLLFAALLLACVGAAVLITLVTRPRFSSDVFLRIEDNDSRDNLLGNLPSMPGLSENEIETEMLVLRSRELAETVADSLHLRVGLEEPARPRDRLVRVHEAGRSSMQADVELTATGSPGEYGVSVTTKNRIADAPATVRLGEPFDIGDVRMSVMPARGIRAPDRLLISIQPYREAVRQLRRDLNVARPEQEARIVKVEYTASDSLLAADVPNALARAFILYKSYTASTAERSTVGFLQEQVRAYQTQLASSEERLTAFRELRQVVSPQEQATEQVKRLAESQAEMQALEMERDGLRRVLREVEQSAGDGTTSPFRRIVAYPSMFENRAVQEMLTQLNDLENQRARAAQGRTETNEDVRVLDRRISDVEQQLYELTRSYVSNLDSQIAATAELLAQFGGRLDQVPAVEMEFARLARDQKLLEQIYSLLLTRLKEAEVKAAVEMGDVRVIDPALVPDEPVAPRPFRNLLLGTLIGLVLATSAVYVRETSNTSIRSRDEVQARIGDLPVVGYIPHMQAINGAGRLRRLMPARGASADGDRMLLAALLNDGPALEAYRSLRTNLQFLSNGTGKTVVLVTSSIPAEGKSTTSTNLAMTLAREGKRILLVDADLRRGHVHIGLGLPRAPGLAQVLLGEETLAAARRPIPGADNTRLDVLTAGAYPPNAAELLASPRMAALMEQARAEYDTIILDAPPVTAVTDAAVLSRYSDTALLVVRSGRTPKAALEHTMSQLQHVGARLRGVVINDIDREKDAGYYAYAYHDYESRPS